MKNLTDVNLLSLSLARAKATLFSLSLARAKVNLLRASVSNVSECGLFWS